MTKVAMVKGVIVTRKGPLETWVRLEHAWVPCPRSGLRGFEHTSNHVLLLKISHGHVLDLIEPRPSRILGK